MVATVFRRPNQGWDTVLWYDPLCQVAQCLSLPQQPYKQE